MAIASSMVGWLAPNPAVNCANSVEPMPMMTASTSTLMPEEMTLPSTRSARKAVLPNSPKGTSTKPASVVSLNSISVTKSWIARMKKASRTIAQANSRIAIWTKFVEEGDVAHQPGDGLEQRPPGIEADLRDPARLQQLLRRMVEPEAT